MAEKKNNGCFGLIVIIIFIGIIIDKCEESNQKELLLGLNKTIVEINKLYIGTYEGKLYSEANIPQFNIHPEYQFVKFKIRSFVPVIIDKNSIYYKDLSKSFDTNRNHIEGTFICEFESESGEYNEVIGIIYYFPDDKKFCIGSASDDVKSGSLFGGDMCDIIFTPSLIELYSGDLKGKLFKN